MIGIVGGIGPLAGVDLYKKIIEHTLAEVDQDHLPVLLASLPGDIIDRTTFLMGHSDENPAEGLAKVILMLEKAGANLIAIACNTAHAPAIFNPTLQFLKAQNSTVEIVNLIDVTLQAISLQKDQIQRVGVLCTSGSYKTKIYQQHLEEAGLIPVMLPFGRHTELVHDAIYRIKHCADKVEEEVISQLNTAILEMKAMGAQAVILGCTEIGMIEELLDFQGLAVFNPNTVMARALIQKHDPKRLRLESVEMSV